jgi:hypothetical protein
MLQDSSFGIHSLEGPCGTDIFVLDRLFDEPESLKMRPTNILARIEYDAIPVRAYLPRLLGTSVPEIVARLYARYAHAASAARKICFTFVRNTYDGNENANSSLVREMFYNAAELCTDVIFSVWSIAMEKFDTSACPARISMTELEPFEFPMGGSGGYRFLSFVKNEAVTPSLEKIPLRLIMSGKTLSFDSGISMGSHYEGKLLYWIPEKIYSRFYACIGLHPECLNPTGVKIELLNDGNPVAEFLFNNERPAEIIELKNPEGIFGIKFSYPVERACHCNNIIVIGNGFFHKIL